MYSLALLESVWICFLVLSVVLDDCDQSDLFREEKDEQTYSQTDCYVWLKSGIQKRVALASVFSHGS